MLSSYNRYLPTYQFRAIKILVLKFSCMQDTSKSLEIGTIVK